ncbi:Protein bli-3 [Erysiphe neolycopersici]|uniref:Protein bli-3 n=1 Tax=Erysiphe neolycopersici TaxID=212602 RepID=A0A420I7B3_9PEZI|nr:Protein bli-3 [Erysiphe neolycopersici]
MVFLSNTDGHEKPADPYKTANLDQCVSIKDKVNDLSDFVDSCKFGIMTTRDSSSGALVSRCMVVAAKEVDGIDLIFYTNTESGKVDDIKSDPHVNVSFIDSSGQWASFAGKSSILTESGIVAKYYSPTLKAWIGDLGDGKHDGSPNDPRLGIIKVQSKTITYAITNNNAITRGFKVAQGAVTGNPPAIHRLRELSETEVSTWRASKDMIE